MTNSGSDSNPQTETIEEEALASVHGGIYIPRPPHPVTPKPELTDEERKRLLELLKRRPKRPLLIWT